MGQIRKRTVVDYGEEQNLLDAMGCTVAARPWRATRARTANLSGAARRHPIAVSDLRKLVPGRCQARIDGTRLRRRNQGRIRDQVRGWAHGPAPDSRW